MRVKTIIIISLICLLFCGCSGDKYDGLKVVDGNGRVLILHHNIGDNYFIQDMTPTGSTNDEINKKLESKIK